MTDRLRAARLAARTARQRLAGTFDKVQDRLSPDALRDDAIDSMKQQVRDAADAAKNWAGANPGIVAAFASAIGLYLVHRLRTHDGDATLRGATRLNTEPAVRPPEEGMES